MNTPLALIITFNPDSSFFLRFSHFFAEFEALLIVDNGSNGEVQHLLEEIQRDNENLHIIYNPENFGISTALNQGFQWAIEHVYQEVVPFDQDSFPLGGMVAELKKVQQKHLNKQSLAIVAPIIADPIAKVKAQYPRPRYKVFFERKSCEGETLENITSVITAGALYNLDIYQKLGPFLDDFFIDYVDTEYCLRANQNGYKIAVACEAYLNHRLGERERRKFLGITFFPTFHSPLRWYYISRNRIPMLKKYALHMPHWFFYEIIASFYTLIRMLFFENHKKSKLQAIFLGTRDGLCGKMGKARNEIVKKLSD